MIVNFVQKDSVNETQLESIIEFSKCIEEYKIKLTLNTLYVYNGVQVNVHNLVK